jgi:aminoglycoside phosphotransferase family enzyme/predicted kinase
MDGIVVPRASLVDALRDPRAYPHPVDRVSVIETHISWVFLAGDYAYKVKKPVKLPFVDFATLESRRYYCQEELRLNRRVAPRLYLDVVPIAGDPPAIGQAGNPVEYAVKMRRFAQDDLLSMRARRGTLTPAIVDALAEKVAAMHASAPVAARVPREDAAQRAAQPALDNFVQLRRLEHRLAKRHQLDALKQWTTTERGALAGVFGDRCDRGFVRECHGDLHLGNVALVDGEPMPFDALEFSARLRFGDVMSDVAFMVMDLVHEGLPGLAARFLNSYLEITGDYEGLRVLRFYLVYRALVRAKVALIRAAQERGVAARHDADLASFDSHLRIAGALAGDGHAMLVAMHGPSGSGKTRESQQLLEALGAVRLRSDVERKRLHGYAPGQSSHSAPGEGIYTQHEGRRVYARLAEIAEIALKSGWPVIVDAACLERSQRDLFAAVALRTGVPLRVVSCAAPLATLRARIAHRAAQGHDASEAGLAVLDLQLAAQQPLGADEMEHVTVLDTTRWPATAEAASFVSAYAGAGLGHRAA